MGVLLSFPSDFQLLSTKVYFFSKKKSLSQSFAGPARGLELAQIDPHRIPILRAEQIIHLLGLDPVIRSLRQLSCVSDKQFELLYRPVIERFIEAAQLVPASTAHHHAGLGGLVVHTLNVAERALKRRKRFELPQHAEPEVIAEHEHAWTYGVFVGAMLHDVGKLLANYCLKLDNRKPWNPFGASILQTGASTYRIDFLSSDYRLHVRLGPAFWFLVPEAGRQWLAQRADLLIQLMAWLLGDWYECGAIGEIIMDADRSSVAENLKLGGDRDRLAYAPTIPVIERLMMSLRALLEKGEIKVNLAGGGAGWVDGVYTWLACGVVAKKVVAQLKEAGASGIPTDNARLFDIWQEHGYALSTPEGKAVWHVEILGPEDAHGNPGYRFTLTMLKFETGRLFHPSRRPSAFGGVIRVLSEQEAMAEKPQATSSDDAQEVQDDARPAGESLNLKRSPTDADEEDPFAPMVCSMEQTKESAPTCGECSGDTPAEGESASQTGSVVPNNGQYSAPRGLLDPALAKHFISWVRTGILDKSIVVNRPEAKVHVVAEGVLLVTPIIFQHYLRTFGLLSEGMPMNKAFKKIQQVVQKLGLHIKAINGMNVHTYRVEGDNKKGAHISGYLFPVALFYDHMHEPPEPNRYLHSAIKKELGE